MKRTPPVSENPVDLLFDRVVALVHLKDRDFSLRQLAVLAICVDAQEPPTVRGLARHLGIAKPAVTRAINRLEAAKLVRRKPDPSDRRSILIVPSPAGRRFHARFFETETDSGRG